MKKSLLLLILSCLLSGNSAWAETVRLAIGDWEPYTSATNPNGKLLEKVVTEAFKLEGVVVEYTYFPWKRSIITAETGASDGTFPWNKTTEREGLFHIHKTPLLRDDSVYFHLKSTPFDWKSMDDIKKYKVGVTIGYKEEKIYKDKGINADPVPSEEMNFKKMLSGRIDIYMTSKVVGYATISKLFAPEEARLFTNHPTPVEQGEFYILFSRKTANGKALADKFDSGMKKLKDSGAYKKILAEYGV